MGGVGDLLQRPRQRVRPRLPDRSRLIRLMEYQSCTPGAGSLVKDTLRAQNALFGNGGPCRVQLVRRLVGLADRLLQFRRGAFLV